MVNIPLQKSFLNNNSIETNNYQRDKNIRNISFKHPFFSISPIINFNPFAYESVKLNGDTHQSKQTNSLSFDIGVSGGLLLSQDKKIYIKLGVFYKKLNFKLTSDYSYSYNDTDEDKDQYLRLIELKDIQENHELAYLSFPIGIQKHFELSSNYLLILELGGSWNYNLSAQYKTSAIGKYSGFYEQLFGLTISENGVYNFGEFEVNNNEQLTPNPNLLLAYARLTVARRINKRTLINFGVNYNYGLNKLYQINTKGISDNHTVINSLSNISPDYYLREFQVSISLFYKF